MNLRQANRALHLYLSPHFDDAVLSCGGLIAQQSERGERVVIATLCAGTPPPGATSAFADFQHQRWLTAHPGADPIALRQAEDEAACAVLGAEPIYFQELDCIYRQSKEGVWLYDSEESLWGAVHPEDDASILAEELATLVARLRPDAIYAPLAAGNHIDHQRTRQIAEAWVWEGWPVFFYEDYPYVERSQSLWYALNRPAPGRWLRLPQMLTPTAAALKQRAVTCYASQIDVLFSGDANTRLLAYQLQVGAPGLAEVLWQPAVDTASPANRPSPS